MVGITIGIYLVFGTIYTILVYTSSEGYLREKYEVDLLSRDDESIKTDCYELSWEAIGNALTNINYLQDVDYYNDACDITYNEKNGEASIYIEYITNKREEIGNVLYVMQCDVRNNLLELKRVKKTNTEIDYGGVPEKKDLQYINETFDFMQTRIEGLTDKENIRVYLHVGSRGEGDEIKIFIDKEKGIENECIEKYVMKNKKWVKVDS